MDYLYDNWGNLASEASVVGLLATIIGLGVAVWQVTVARKAAEASRDAASAARTASVQTRDAIHGVLTVSDLQRSIGYVQELKEFHRYENWDVCLNMYHILRESLAHIRARLPVQEAIQRRKLRESIDQMRVMEDNVDDALKRDTAPTASEKFNKTLNEIQVWLEEIVSSVQTREGEVST